MIRYLLIELVLFNDFIKIIKFYYLLQIKYFFVYYYHFLLIMPAHVKMLLLLQVNYKIYDNKL